MKLKNCYKKMDFFKFQNKNPLEILANKFLVKFEQFLYIKYELFK